MQNAARVAKSNRDGIAHIQVYRRGALITLAREGARTVVSVDAVGSKHHPARSAGRSGVDVQQQRHAGGDARVSQSSAADAEGSGAARVVLNHKRDPIGAASADILVSKGRLERTHVERITEPAAA